MDKPGIHFTERPGENNEALKNRWLLPYMTCGHLPEVVITLEPVNIIKITAETVPTLKIRMLMISAFKILKTKINLFKETGVTLVGCSKWMASLAKESALFKNARVESIPNTLNTEIFKPADKNIFQGKSLAFLKIKCSSFLERQMFSKREKA